MPPEGTDLILTTNILHCERDIQVVFYSLHVEPNEPSICIYISFKEWSKLSIIWLKLCTI